MDLIDRYLHAIRRNLPPAKADDIVAELSDDLFSRKEDREARLGRELTKDEASALLKDFGHPLVVASRFRTHQYLIGPALYPFYLSVMRIVLMIVVAIVFAVSVIQAALGSGNPLDAWVGGMSGIFGAVMINAALVTLVFAVLERTGLSAAPLIDWVPDHLPDVFDKQQGPWNAAFEVAASIAFLLWWTGVIHLPFDRLDADFRLVPGAIFTALYWPILIVAVARLAHNLVQWLRPRWKRVRAVLGVATALGGLALLILIYQAGDWALVISNGMAAEQVVKLQESLNLALRIAIIVVGVVWTLGCLGSVWRLFRTNAPANA